MEISIGDYVLSGGELPAAVLCDSMIRLIPGVLGNETSALTDSFQDNLLAPPVYTRPSSFNDMKSLNTFIRKSKRKLRNGEKIKLWKEQKNYDPIFLIDFFREIKKKCKLHSILI